ncbi:hypothetical protein JCM24511_09341 [Saitozyma sp. JCM 24511]|nr:hypothetical protein JCM24511_09341 [Saitozyma sp. JCM 24511]
MFWKGSKAAINTDPEELAKRGLDPQAVADARKSKEERWFLMKLDIFLLTFGCCSQVIKYIDQTNINNAYVSGMSEALALNGNQLNYFTTYFNVGYCLFLIPSQVMITRFRPSLWLSGLEFFWGILTGCIAACKSANAIYVLRAFIGVAESSAYPGTVTLLMTWYTPLEMAKRIGFYHSMQAVGSMMSGAIQSGINSSLDGTHGIAGWQWTFIINCIMTLCIAVLGPFMIPDFPDRPNPWARWLTPRDKEIVRARLARFTRESPNPINIACAVRTFKNPILYMMIYIYVSALIAPSGNGYFSLWLKSLKDANGKAVWSTVALNAIPIGGSAMQLAAVWIFAFGSDLLRTRWLMLIPQCLIGLTACIIMTIWNVPNSAKYYSYFILYFCTASGPPLWAWMSDMLPRDAEQRAFIIAVCISLYYAINAWSNVLIFPTVQAPHYKYGWPVCIVLWITPRNYRIAQEVAAENAVVATQSYEGQQVEQTDDKVAVEDPKSSASSVRVLAV